MFAENQMHRGIRTHQPPRLGSVRCRRIFYHHPPVVSQDNLGATGYAVGAPGGGKGYRPTSDVEARNAIIALGITFMKRCRQFYDTHGEELFSKLIGELDRACGGCKGPNAITVNYWRGFNISMFQNWQTGNGMTIPDTIQMQTAIIDLLLADATPELLIETMAGQGEPTLAGCERIAQRREEEFSLYQAAQSLELGTTTSELEIILAGTFVERCTQFRQTHGDDKFKALIAVLDRASTTPSRDNVATNLLEGTPLTQIFTVMPGRSRAEWQRRVDLVILYTIRKLVGIVDALLADTEPNLLIDIMAGQRKLSLAGCERIAKKTGKEFSLYQAAQSPKEQATETNLPECYPGQCGRRVPAVDPDNPIQNLADAIRELEYSEGNKDY